MKIFHIHQDGSIFTGGIKSLDNLEDVNLRSKNIPGKYNFAVERLIANRFQINLSIYSDIIVFDEINLEIRLINFLSNGGFDESESKHFVEDFLFRLDSVESPLINKDDFKIPSPLKQKRSLFPIDSNHGKLDDFEISKPSIFQTNLERDVTIGVTISSKKRGKQFFLSLLSTFFNSLERISVIVCCFLINKGDVEELILETDFPLSKVFIIGQGWGFEKANQGKLGPWFLDDNNQSGVSFGRCILHRALFEFSKNEIILITDDDILFKNQNVVELNNSINMMLESNKIIGIGTIVGDAPLHPSYVIRTQSIDFFYSRISSKKSKWHFEKNGLSTHDLHHDLSTTRTDHLEVPVGLERAHKINIDEWSICSGKSLTRPIHREWRQLDKVPTRGGNTLILNRYPLIRWPNVAPKCGGIQFRRGDTLWTRLIEQEDSRLICPIPLALEQSRIESPNTFGEIDSVRGDILGSMFTRAIVKKNLDAKSIISYSRLRESRLIMNLIRSEYLLNALDYNEKLISELQFFTNKLIENPFPGSLESDLDQFIFEMDNKVDDFRKKC